MPLLTELENVLGCDSTKMPPLTELVQARSFSMTSWLLGKSCRGHQHAASIATDNATNAAGASRSSTDHIAPPKSERLLATVYRTERIQNRLNIGCRQ